MVQNQEWVLYSFIAQCRVRSIGSSAGWTAWKQQEGRTCDTSPSHTRVILVCCWRSCDSGLQGVGLLHQQRWQLVHHPALSHHLHWVKRASQDGAGLLDKFFKSPPVCSLDAAAPADDAIENGWCHHRVIERSKEYPLLSKGPELPQQMESALTFLVCSCSLISPFQVIVHVNSQVLVRCHHQLIDSNKYPECRHENHSPFGEIWHFETKIGDLRE